MAYEKFSPAEAKHLRTLVRGLIPSDWTVLPHPLKRDEDGFPIGVGGYTTPSTKTVHLPAITDVLSLYINLHEIGHVLDPRGDDQRASEAEFTAVRYAHDMLPKYGFAVPEEMHRSELVYVGKTLLKEIIFEDQPEIPEIHRWIDEHTPKGFQSFADALAEWKAKVTDEDKIIHQIRTLLGNL